LDVAVGFDQENIVLLCDLEEVLEFGEGRGGGLFENDMLLCLEDCLCLRVVERVGRGNVDSVEVRVLGERVDGCVENLDGELVGKGASRFLTARVDGCQLPLLCCLSALNEGLGDPVGEPY
jgi:hypothetical protein